MTTKTQTFTNKVKSLRDFHFRLLSATSLPSAGDIQSTLKFFQTTLLGLLKDAPLFPPESYGSRKKAQTTRLAVLPNFDYTDLFYALVSLSEVACRLPNPTTVCENLINCFSLLTPFLDYDCLDCLPFIIASLLHYFPINLQSSIMEFLCASVIPLVYTWNEEPESYAIDSIPSIFLTVFQLVEKTEYHSWLVEEIMSKKSEVYKDLLTVIAYGPTESRLPAVCMLFHYWPELFPSAFQNSQILLSMKYKYESWKPIYCERPECPNKASKAAATMMSVETSIAAKYGAKAPPIYICFDCADALRRQGVDGLISILRPMQDVSHSCESRTCRSQYTRSYSTCFSPECTVLTGGKPVRFCENCHVLRHQHATNATKRHIYQLPLPDVWDCPMEWQSALVEAIVSLSQETKPKWRQQLIYGSGGAMEGVTGADNAAAIFSSVNPMMGLGQLNVGGTASVTSTAIQMMSIGGGGSSGLPGACANSLNSAGLPGTHPSAALLEKQPGTTGPAKGGAANVLGGAMEHWLFGRYSDDDHKILAVYCTFLIGEKCKPRENNNVEVLGRICAALFHWFHDTIYSFDDELGDLIEKVKSEYIIKWIQQALSMHLEVVLVTVLPHPVEYARIGFYWSTLCDRTTQVKQGLQKLSSLIPYDITTFELWDYIIPYWLETIRTEVSKANYNDLQGLLRKIFDATAGPFPFVPAKLYHFASERFANTPVAVQDQVLSWLEILTLVSVAVPVKELLIMFRRGVDSLRDPIPLVDAGSSYSSTQAGLSQLELASAGGDVTTHTASIPNSIDRMIPLTSHCEVDPTVEMLEYEEEGDEDEFELALGLRQPRVGAVHLENTGGKYGPSGILSNLPPPTTIANNFTVLKCFRMMLKITLDQIKLQDPKSHSGIHGEPASSVMMMIAEMLSISWDGEHTCSLKYQQTTCTASGEPGTGGNAQETSAEPPPMVHKPRGLKDKSDSETECSFCMECLEWHTLTAQLSHLLTPLKTHQLPKIDLPELDTTAAAAKPNLDNIDENDEEVSSVNFEAECQTAKLPGYLRVLHELMKEIGRYRDVEISNQILLSLTYLCRHADALTHAVTSHRDFVVFLLKKYLVPTLWNLLTSENSFLAAYTVPLLIHCWTLPTGADVYWNILEKDFSSEDWRVRFKAVENVTVLLRQLEESHLVNNHFILTSLAHSACALIGSLDDIQPAVVQRAVFYIESIRERSLNCAIRSLEFQFDVVIADRSLILQRMHQLSCALTGRNVFTWDFFLNRFSIFSIEAQLTANPDTDISRITDINNVNKSAEHNQQFRDHFMRAKFAVSRNILVRSINSSGSVKFVRRRSSLNPAAFHNMHGGSGSEPGSEVHEAKGGSYAASKKDPSSASADPGLSHSRSYSGPKSHTDMEKPYARQASAPGRRKSKSSISGAALYGGTFNVTECTDIVSKFVSNIQEGSNKDTLHQWVALLLKFMVTVDVNTTKDELRDKKSLSKVLRHLGLLLGYSEQAFSITPYKLRCSTVFHAFICNISQVLDRNMELANSILHLTLVVLQFCASPQRYATDNQPPTFTLWLLEPHTRIPWLNALLVILYKYDYSSNSSGCQQIVEYLMKIALNTVDAHLHVCKRQEEGMSPPTPHMPRLRDTSNVSVDCDMGGHESVSASPSPRPSITLSRMSRPNTTHYTKRERDGDFTSLKITPPVLKKKGSSSRHQTMSTGSVGRRARTGRASLTFGKSDDTLYDHYDKDCESAVPDGGMILEEEEDEDYDEDDDVIELEAQTILPVMEEDPASTPVTVSHDESTISPPLMEEAAAAAAIAGAANRSVDAKIAEQLEAFQLDTRHSLPDVHVPNPEETPVNKPKRSSSVLPGMTRKTGLSGVVAQKALEKTANGSHKRLGGLDNLSPSFHNGSLNGMSSRIKRRQTYQKCLETFMVDRCPKCGAVSEHYDEETLGLAIVCVGTFVQREPVLAAPHLLDMLTITARLASYNMYSWKSNQPNVVIPGNAVSIARQFLRCTLFHLAPNGIFMQLFETFIEDETFFKTIVSVLLDFEEHVNVCQPLEMFLDGFNKKRVIGLEGLIIVLHNILCYLESIPTVSDDTKTNHQFITWWTSLMPHFETFMRRLPQLIPQSTSSSNSAMMLSIAGGGGSSALGGLTGAGGSAVGLSTGSTGSAAVGLSSTSVMGNINNIANQMFDLTNVIRIMLALMRSPVITNFKSIIEEFNTVLRYMVENCRFQLGPLLELCSVTNRMFKERGRVQLTKTLVEVLHLAIKFKVSIPDDNLLMLMQLVLMDAGGSIEPNKISESLTKLFNPQSYHILNTSAAEFMRAHLQDCILFISDVRTVHNVKQVQKSFGGHSLHEDTLGPHLKSAVAQYIALELSRNFNSSSGRTDALLLQYMPWIKSIPPATQQGPKEFIACVERIRTLSWILLGSMIHTSVTKNSTGISCLPIPLNYNKSIADLVKVILSGFPDQQKRSEMRGVSDNDKQKTFLQMIGSRHQTLTLLQSVVVMSSLSHAFNLCQLWTLYCESWSSIHVDEPTQQQLAMNTAMDFWAHIMPAIIHLLTISDDFNVVNGHLLGIMDQLIECRSSIVSKVITLLIPILYGRKKLLSGNNAKRLQKCIDWEAPEPGKDDEFFNSNMLMDCLKRHVIVLGKNEAQQSSAASHIIVI